MIWLLLAAAGLAAEPGLHWRRNGTWRSPTPIERAAVIRAVDAVVRDAEACSEPVLDRAGEELGRVGLRLQVHSVDDARLVQIGEGSEAFGAGLLAVRCGTATDVVWQAPHPRFDLGTGDLVLSLFHQSRGRVAMWATHHRFRARPAEVREDAVHPADVSAEPGSLFQAMTVAISAADPELRFVQVHGYAASTAPGVDVIASTGDQARPPSAVAERLDPLFGRVRVFGLDTAELGGTLNVQGRLLARWPGRFLHLELSPRSRERLLEDAALRGQLIQALEGAW